MGKTQLDYMEYANDDAAQAAYVSSDGWNLLNENCSDISDWEDFDFNTGVSEVDPAGQFRFDTNLGAAGDAYALRKRTLASPPDKFTIEIKTYFDTLGTYDPNRDHARLDYSTSTWLLRVHFSSDGLFIVKAGAINVEVGTNIIKHGGSAAWQTWRFEVDKSGGEASATVEVFLDDVSQGTFDCDYEIASTDGQITFGQFGYTSNNMVSHVDYVKVGELNLQCYSEDTIKEQGSYALKAIAKITNSLNDTLTRTMKKVVEFGVFTSVEYGHESTAKLSTAVSDYNSWGPNFVIDLGDFIDRPESNHDQALTDLDVIEAVYDDLTMSRYYAFGNHDLDYISKSEFIAHTGMSEKYYSFDVGNYHFIVLDHCFRSDNDDDDYDSGNFDFNVAYIPPNERTWLTNDLSGTSKKTIVFVEYHLEGIYAVTNASQIRTILENSGKVLAVFSGNEGANRKVTINEIDYYGLFAMDLSTENAYAKVRIYPDDSIYIEGVGDQTTYGDFFFPSVDLTDQTQIKFDIRASRTGSHIKIGIHDSGGTTTEHTANIAQANVNQTETWDISGVANANKDDIDSIIITIVNADADNTFYIDNMYAEIYIFEYVGTGTLTYSGTAITIIGFTYAGSGSFVTSGSGICQYEKSEWEYAGSGTYNFSGVGLYSLGLLYVGVGEFVHSGSATQVYARYYLYAGSGVFSYSGEAVLRWGDWTEITKGFSNFIEVDKKTSDWSKVEKGESD